MDDPRRAFRRSRRAPAACPVVKLDIDTYQEGFDLDGDGMVDNSLAALGALANSEFGNAINDGALLRVVDFHDLVPIPAEVGDDSVVHLAIRSARYPQDADRDGLRSGAPGDPGQPGGDCRDRLEDPLAPAVHPAAAEDVANFVDDDCNGYADDSFVPWTDLADAGCAASDHVADGGCLVPDIEMNGDGLECFIDDQPNDGVDRVTLCVDGDGTEVRDGFESDAQGRPKSCTEAHKPDGTPRFVDGLSLTLKFTSIPTRVGAVETP